MEKKVIPIFIQDLFGTIRDEPVFTFEPGVVHDPNEILFVSGDDLVNFAKTTTTRKGIVTFVVPGLSDVYWVHRNEIMDEVAFLEDSVNLPVPTFKKLEGGIFQLEGILTPYSIVYITLQELSDRVRKREPVIIKLQGINVLIKLE